MNLTVGLTTSRKEPLIEYFFDSLAKQIEPHDKIDIIVVDYFKDDQDRSASTARKFSNAFAVLPNVTLQHVNCMPTIWQGKHQVTKEAWWAKSAYLNTIICLCKSDFVSFVDDRSWLGLAWLDSVERAMNSMYAVCGSYEKWSHLDLHNNRIVGGELLGEDTRNPGLYPFDSYYGGSGALPLEWCLKMNGFPMVCDGAGTEDSMFGVLLKNNGYPIYYDSDMRLIQDRTPGQIDGALKRADKNPHLGQQAKSWAIVRLFKDKLTSQNEFDIRNLRDRILLNGESLDSIGPFGPYIDFYDGQPISEMT